MYHLRQIPAGKKKWLGLIAVLVIVGAAMAWHYYGLTAKYDLAQYPPPDGYRPLTAFETLDILSHLEQLEGAVPVLGLFTPIESKSNGDNLSEWLIVADLKAICQPKCGPGTFKELEQSVHQLKNITSDDIKKFSGDKEIPGMVEAFRSIQVLESTPETLALGCGFQYTEGQHLTIMAGLRLVNNRTLLTGIIVRVTPSSTDSAPFNKDLLASYLKNLPMTPTAP